MDTDRLPAHGTRARYGRGCKCRDCTQANTAYQREYRLRLSYSAPTYRTARGVTWHEPRLPFRSSRVG